MATDDAQFADRLNHLLDALSDGAASSPNGSLPDHELAAFIQDLHAYDDAPPADPRFADRLLEDLMHATTLHDATAFPQAPLPLTVRDRFMPSPALPARSRPGRTLGQLATAALVLLALVGSIVVLGPLRPPNAAWLPIVPAISRTPEVLSGIVIETLIDIPDASLPAGPVQLYAGYTELPPGMSQSLGNQFGTSAYYIEQGSVKIRHADEEKVVHTGEQWISAQEGDWGLENVGDDMARVIEADVNDALRTSSVEANYHSKFSETEGYADIFVIQAASTLPSDGGRLTLERIMLPPGTAMEPYAKQEFQWLGVAQGRVGVTLVGERLPFRWDSGEERSFGLYKSPPAIQAGTEVTLRSVGNAPLVLYRLTIVPNDAEDAAAATP
jgi:hypothetical protein